MKFVGRFSGVVTYQDDSYDQFAAHLDERGNVSVNSGDGDSPNESNQAILEVQTDHNWLEHLIDLVSSSLALSPSGSASKTVTGMTAHFSGRVANDDDTWEDFAVQYDVKAGGEFVLNGSGDGSGTVTAYNSFPSATIQSWFESLVGSGNVTV